MVNNSLQLSAFRAMFQTMVDTAIISNSEGKILYVNSAIEKLLEYRPEEVIGNNLNMLMPIYHGKNHNKYISDYLTNKNPKVIGTGRKVMAKDKAGNLVPCWLSLSEFEHNNEPYFTGILSDISELEKANQELETINNSLELTVEKRTNQLKEALEHAKELNVLKSKFMTLASHEFKTPLSTILSSAILIEKHGEKLKNLSENQGKHISRIKRSVGLMTKILEEFLNVEKAEKNIIHTNVTNFSPKDLIDETVALMQLHTKDGQILETLIPERVENINSDYQLNLQILMNLLSNALKYSDRNKKIIMEFTENSSHAIFKVIDEGRGISEKDQKHVFERFFRAENVKAEKGTGIGLHISKKYASLLGGELEFTSEENIGSCFILTLPKN